MPSAGRSCANGACAAARSPPAWKKRATNSSPSCASQATSGSRSAPPTPSSGCTRSSSDASRPNACCPAPTPLACCSGRYWPAAISPYAKLTAGRPCMSPLPSKFLIWWHKPITSPLEITAIGNSHQVNDATSGIRDRQSDIEPLRLGSAAIGGLHDAGAAAGADNKALLLLVELFRPLRQPLGKLSRGFVIDRQRERHLRRLDALSGSLRLGQHGLCRLLRAQPRRPHKDDRVLDVVALEAIERLQILRQHPQRARIPAPQKAGVLICLGLAAAAPAGLVQSAPRSLRFRSSTANKGRAMTGDKPIESPTALPIDALGAAVLGHALKEHARKTEEARRKRRG